MIRSIVSIAISGVGENCATQCEAIILALASDGTLWSTNNRDMREARPWALVENVPQDTADHPHKNPAPNVDAYVMAARKALEHYRRTLMDEKEADKAAVVTLCAWLVEREIKSIAGITTGVVVEPPLGGKTSKDSPR